MGDGDLCVSVRVARVGREEETNEEAVLLLELKRVAHGPNLGDLLG
jgi:hypothetical protein